MSALAQDVYLDSFLGPLAPWLARDDVTDIYINRPGEVWIETLGGGTERFATAGLTARVLQRLARQIAATSAQGINRHHPLLSASLPDGSRVQVVLPPATRGEIAMAIRKHVISGMSLDDYDAAGAFSETHTGVLPEGNRREKSSSLAEGGFGKMLRQAVRGRRNILVSGGTSSGKTTFLNALLQEVPQTERLIVIEDTPELQLTHPNATGLLAVRGTMGEAEVSAEDLLVASLRMRPDRIILGEIRGQEALTFLRAVNTGHPGSLCTIHADSPERAIDQLALLVLQSGVRMNWDDVVRYIRQSIDVMVHFERTAGGRKVRDVVTI